MLKSRLFPSDARNPLRSTIREHLESGVSVVCDRYSYSGVAFSASKPGEYCKDALVWYTLSFMHRLHNFTTPCSYRRFIVVHSAPSLLTVLIIIKCSMLSLHLGFLMFLLSRPGLEIGWCKDPDRGLPAPDMILFLDISVEDAMKVCHNYWTWRCILSVSSITDADYILLLPPAFRLDTIERTVWGGAIRESRFSEDSPVKILGPHGGWQGN